MSPIEAWFAAWQCDCTCIARSAAGLPDRCPVHDTPLIAGADGNTRLQLNHSGVSGYGFIAGGAR